MDNIKLIVPLSSKAHHYAREFATEQASSAKGKQVYLNTLSVYAVHKCLQWVNIDTDLTQGDSWHPGRRAIFDVADLMIPDWGKLECRPVLPRQNQLILSSEVLEDRNGYAAVQFGTHLNQAEMLGFTHFPHPPSLLNSLDIKLNTLEPFENLFDYLPDPSHVPAINLNKWLQNDFTEAIKAGWKTIEAVLNIKESVLFPIFAFRPTSTIVRCKLIDFREENASYSLVLVVSISLLSPQTRKIRLHLLPGKAKTKLPNELQFKFFHGQETLDEKIFINSQGYNLEFEIETNNEFNLSLTLKNKNIIQKFIV